MLGTSKSIWGFDPRSIPGCTLWLDGADNASMNSTSAVTVWNDKSGQSNTMTGSGTWSGGTMVFNGTTNAFSNLSYAFPHTSNTSLYVVLSNTTPPAAGAYMNAVYGSSGFPMVGVFDSTRLVAGRPTSNVTSGLASVSSPSNQVGWATSMQGFSNSSSPIGYGIVTDSSGNVILTGTQNSIATFYNAYIFAGGTLGGTLPAATSGAIFVAKYTPAGVMMWVAQILPGSWNGVATMSAIDSSGNIFVGANYPAGTACTVYNTGGTTGATLTASVGVTNSFIAKYTPIGTVAWAARIGGTANAYQYGVATDTSGNVFACGAFFLATATSLTIYNSDGTPGATLSNVANANITYLVKYSSTGTVLWATRFTVAATFAVRGFGITADASGDVFVGGHYNSGLTFLNTGGTTGTTLTFVGTGSAFIVKYTSTGTAIWATQITNTSLSSTGLARDGGGNVFIVGAYTTATTLYNTGGSTGTTLANGGASNVYIAKYTSAGNLLWATRIVSTGAVRPAGGIVTDTLGNVFISGSRPTEIATFYNSDTSVGGQQAGGNTLTFVVKYSSTGTYAWSTYFGGHTPTNPSNSSTGIAVDANQNVFVTGRYNGELTAYNANAISSGYWLSYGYGGFASYLVKLNPDGNMTTSNSTQLNTAASNIVVSSGFLSGGTNYFLNGRYSVLLGGVVVSTPGIYIGGPSNYFNGTISEVLIYTAVLTTTQRQTLEGYLAYKWGIAARLNILHPYYTIRPFTRSFTPTDIPGCVIWMDGADNSTMNSTTAVTTWKDKSGNSLNMTGSGTWSGSNMVFNGFSSAFSNTAANFSCNGYSVFTVFSNTTAPAASAYMNAVYGGNGYPMLGIYGSTKHLSILTNATNTQYAIGGTSNVGWAAKIQSTPYVLSNTVTYSVATDSSCNVFAAGICGSNSIPYNSSGIASAALPNIGYISAFLIKYTPTGAISWVTQMGAGTNSSTYGYGVAVDSTGNPFIIGQAASSFPTILYNSDQSSGATLTGPCIFLAKYSTAGVLSWALRITGALGSNIAIDSGNNIFLIGSYASLVTFYNSNGTSSGTTLAAPSYSNIWIARYSSGGVFAWVARSGAPNINTPYGICVDSTNVYVTGALTNSITTFYNSGGSSGATVESNVVNNYRGFLVKYSSAGVVQWVTKHETNIGGYCYTIGCSVDASGNVFIAGRHSGGTRFFNSNGTTIGATVPAPSTARSQGVIAKYSSTGTLLWTAEQTGNNNVESTSIALDPSGNAIVYGYGGGATAVNNMNANGTIGATLTGVNNGFITKYSSSGTVIWATQYDNQAYDQSVPNRSTITTDIAGDIIIGGSKNGNTVRILNVGGSLGATLVSNAVGYYATIFKISSSGYTNGGYPVNSNTLVDFSYTYVSQYVSSVTPYINGGVASRQTGLVSVINGIYLGGPSNYFNGTISEVLVYNSNLTNTQRQQVEWYLSSKWRLLSPLLSNQPSIQMPSSITPTHYSNVTPAYWRNDWQPYLKQLANANSNITVTTSQFIGGGSIFVFTNWGRGGVLGPNGVIYYAPYNSSNYLILDTINNTLYAGGVGLTLVSGFNNWVGGALGPDGNIYFAPYIASNVIKFNPVTGLSSYISAPYSQFAHAGGVCGPDGNVYFAPYNSGTIRRVNVLAGTVTDFPVGGGARGWSGIVLGPDGNIYCPPFNTTSILKFVIATQTGSSIPAGGSGWSGGVLASDGCIYFAPNSGTASILKLDVETGVTSLIAAGGVGWAGGVLGPDGNVYFAPEQATSVLKLDIKTGVTSNIIGGLAWAANAYNGNGTLGPDGCMYITPNSGQTMRKVTFGNVTQNPSMNYLLSSYANKF